MPDRIWIRPQTSFDVLTIAGCQRENVSGLRKSAYDKSGFSPKRRLVTKQLLTGTFEGRRERKSAKLINDMLRITPWAY
jgi:hypothetical protein